MCMRNNKVKNPNINFESLPTFQVQVKELNDKSKLYIMDVHNYYI